MVYVADGSPADSVTKGNVTACYDLNNQLLGYNIMSEKFADLKDGYHQPEDDLMNSINEELSANGFEVLVADRTPRIVVGYVEECEEHPDSDHLHVCQVNIGTEIRQIVCGASNVAKGQKVVAALENAVMPDGKLIIPSALRGVPSAGMLCSEWELRLIDEPKKGILVLDDTYVVGQPFTKGA